jgi:transposase
LDNGAFHHSRRLVKPKNVELVYLPAYTPELNGAEKVWQHIKDALGNQLFPTLEELSDCLCRIIQEKLTNQTILSLTAYPYVTQAAMPIFDG